MSGQEVGVQACGCPVNSKVELTVEERKILTRYRELSEIDQRHLQRITHALALAEQSACSDENPKYDV